MFLDELKALPGWIDTEIHEVEFALLVVLHGVFIDPAALDDDGTHSAYEDWSRPNRPR